MEVNNYLLFPTIINETKHDVLQEEKDLWFDLYLKHSHEDGRTHDLLGFEQVHLEPSLEWFYQNKLMPAVRSYFNMLNVNFGKLDVHVTKSFFNVVDQNGINRHNHEENHLSFTYYPHIKPGKERNIIFFDSKRCHANELYPGWFSHYVDGWNEINGTNYGFQVSEGSMFIFPSHLDHDIERKDGDTAYIKGFKTKEDLSESRFCVAGDMLITKKDSVKIYHRTLSSPKNWKVFG